MVLPPDFEASYRQCASYPTQLIHRNLYPYALAKCKARLDEETARGLCIRTDNETHVIFRDLDPTFSDPVKRSIYSDIELRAWLEYQAETDPLTQRPTAPVVSLVTKKDPRCRFVYFYGGDSRVPLKVTRESLTRVLTYHQVMPSYLDFMYVFGKQEKPRDLGYSGFREQTLLSDPPRGPAVNVLGRSGRQYQMSYNLKAPFFKTSPDNLWTIRQAAIHHQFDIVEGTSLWVITKGDRELKNRIELMTGPDGRPEDHAFTTAADCFKSSLAVHTLIAHWAGEDWRWRIQTLEDDIDRATFEAVDASRAQGKFCHFYTPDELTKLQGKSDKITEIVMVLEANVAVLTSIRKYYERLLENKDFTLNVDCEESVGVFAAHIDEMICDMEMQILRAKVLAQVTADRKTIILQHLSSQATVSMENLTKSMYKIGMLSQTEAAAMRIITVLTLLYLPATFVSTFFSTDVVQYQNQGGGGDGQKEDGTSFSPLAMMRWLEVTIPLTFVTVAIAYCWYRRTLKRMADVAGSVGALPLFHRQMWKT
jgi:Mg2+ and Co2+ transporter CorA